MSKTKKVGNNHYEMLFIIPNNFTEDEAKKIIQETEEIIKKTGGEITHQEYWGKKKLTYEIKKFNHGYYNLLEFDLVGEKLASLDRNFKLSKEILRHQIIKIKKRSHEEIEAEKIRQEKAIKKEDTTTKKPEVKEEKKEDKKVEEKPKTKIDSDKGDLKDLDEKLEGILDSSDLI
jgi:small subunit ribosomal protein S6